jgi:exodeoxyribonuclease V beta subunit
MAIQNFHSTASPLHGIHLIQASAGTGKTYTIATLVVRLVLERGLPIQKILVVTFTEAATSELRDRIRKRLQEALEILNGAKGDPIITELVRAQSQTEIATRRLKNALRGFDEAAVFTIHGFCQRMLQDNAFESGQLFDTELVADQYSLLREIAEDFWRLHFYAGDEALINHALRHKLSVEVFTDLLRSHIGKPFLRIIPELESLPVLAEIDARHAQLFAQVRTAWPRARAAVAELLIAPGLNKTSYKPATVSYLVAFMDDFFNRHRLESEALPSDFIKFGSAMLVEKTKKNMDTPRHVFFDLCQDFIDSAQQRLAAYEQHLIALKQELFKYAENQLKIRKQQRNILFFDDLLRNFHHALTRRGGHLLADKVQRQFPAALIDEFQDTDPLQYDIFNHIYARSTKAETVPPLLFLIGDPKQAIYSFRGADIFAYLQAVRKADSNYTLITNWRSSPALINALNAVFGQVARPFIFDEIAFQAAEAAKTDEHPGLPGAALHLWHITREMAGVDKNISKAWAENQIPELVAAEIVALLNADNGVAAADIAVLTRTNRQAQMMQEVLRKYRVPAVLYSRASLFASNEAVEIHRLLSALLEPQRADILRAALCTEMLGWNGNDLYRLEADERRWENLIERFRAYQDIWLRRGFMPMFRRLLLAEGVPAHLLTLADGERRFTNILHLGEVLQHAWVTQGHTPARLLQWLQERCARHAEEQDAFQLRLESDAHAVKVVTIHKSKGLEYPVVFVPFAWDGRARAQKATEFTFHPGSEADLVLDLGSAEQDSNRRRALEEEVAENLRLFYVAVTRAQFRCYVVWGAFNDADNAPPALLWHSGTSLNTLSDAEIRADLNALAPAEVIRVSTPALATALYQPSQEQSPPQLQARRFQRSLRAPWQVSSFTALLANATHDPDQSARQRLVENPEQDALVADNEEQPAFGDIANFPAGARAGEFFHALLENLDFRNPDQWQSLCQNYLARFGFAPEWLPCVHANLENILHTPLAPAGFCLADIESGQRLNELSFFYPVDKLDATALSEILAPAYGDLAPDFDFAQVQGFMRGFIDLVFVHDERFYVVDYKSNRLGSTPADYRTAQLTTAMRRHHYILQYHIYSLALHLYLQARLPGYQPDKHLGGVFYLFLRGMSADSGVFYAPAPLTALTVLAQSVCARDG